MRSLIFVFLSLCAANSWAKHVELVCTPKAYSCYNSPDGYVCRWNMMGGGAPALARAYIDPNFPKEEFGYDLYHSQYQTSVDRHVLRLNMEFKVYPDNRSEIGFVRATLDAGSVIAEASGYEHIDISLRNNNYGRGYVCSSFRVLD